MLNKNFAAYIDQEKGEGYFDYFANDNFFVVFEIREQVDKEKISETFKNFTQKVNASKIESLAVLEAVVYEGFKEFNIPVSSSLVCGYLFNDLIYLKTTHEGVIFVKRGHNFAKIIEGNNCASGFIKTGDFFVFAFSSFINQFKDEKELKKYVDKYNPQEIVGELAQKQDTAALFLQFKAISANVELKIKPENKLISKFKGISGLYAQYKARFDKGKKITIITAVIIFLILIWSVGLGYKRRLAAKRQAQLKISQDLISQKLKSAEDMAFLNLSEAQTLLAQAHRELDTLKKNISDSDSKDIKKIEESIISEEEKILKKEEKRTTEFYDLSMEENGAQGDKAFLDDDTLVILNKKGSIYLLSLSKKSIEKKKNPEIKKVQNIVYFNSKIFLYIPLEGVFEINDKLKKVIDSDKDWGKIVDMNIYNGNLYLLDQTKSDIYKYLTTDDGFGNRKSYFGEDAGMAFTGASSMAIDSAVYISLNNKILKFIGGGQDKFNTTYPDTDVKITKIYTNKSLDKMYVWDKEKGAIYILGKDGSYEKQINTAALKKANDFSIHEDKAYLLIGSKVYQLELD